MATLVTGACVLGAGVGAGLGVPALAAVPPPSAVVEACEELAQAGPTVDGGIDCSMPLTEAPAPTPEQTTTSPAPAEPPKPPTNAPTDPPGGGGADPAPEPSAEADVPRGSELPALSPRPIVPASSAERDRTESGAKKQPSAKQAKPTKERASDRERAAAEGGAEATPRTKAESRARGRTGVEDTAGVGADASSQTGSPGDAATYAALPASWTSLTPLSLPVNSVDGFPIPPFLLPIYQAAAAQYGVPWEILASINEIETDFGRNATVSSAGALGWMQFIYSSWSRWGTDGDGDGRRDPRNPVDAIFAAARYLRDAGAGTDLPKAILAYNHADWYVNRVVKRAREFAGLNKTLVAALSDRALREETSLYRASGNPFAGPGAIKPSPGQSLLLTKPQLTRMVLRSPDIKIYSGGRADIAAGKIDRRVLATLVFLARSGLKPTVSSLLTGHSLRTTSGNVSAHSYGHAADISAINGVSIAGNQGAGSIAAKALEKLVNLQGYERPDQIISLMTTDGQDNTLAMADHADHIHIGFPRVPVVPEAARPADIGKLVASSRASERGRSSAPGGFAGSRRR